MPGHRVSDIVIADRRSLVESMYLQGNPTAKIVTACRDRFGTSSKRNVEADIQMIRRRWKKQAEYLFENDVTSWWVQVALNDRRLAIDSGDIRLGYKIGCDIAKLADVNLKGENLTINIGLDKARAYLDTIMKIVFAHVTDEDTRQAILADLAAIKESA